MRGILCLLPLCLFCLGWSNGTASHLSYNHAPHSSKDAISHPSQSPPGTAVPSPDESGPASPPLLGAAEGGVFADWQIWDDTGLGLTIFSPPGWQFVEDVQVWMLTDGVAEQARAALTGLLLQLQSNGQPDSLIGIGYVSPQFYTDLLHVNQFAVEIFPSNGLDAVPVRLGCGRAVGAADRDRRGQPRTGHPVAAKQGRGGCCPVPGRRSRAIRFAVGADGGQGQRAGR